MYNHIQKQSEKVDKVTVEQSPQGPQLLKSFVLLNYLNSFKTAGRQIKAVISKPQTKTVISKPQQYQTIQDIQMQQNEV